MQREKGRRTELELCHLIREAGFPAFRLRENQYEKSCGLDIIAAQSFGIQCKSGKAIRIAEALKEAVEESDPLYDGLERVAWIRYDGDREGFICVGTGLFLKMMRSYLNDRERENESAGRSGGSDVGATRISPDGLVAAG